MRKEMRKALLHPFGLALLIASFILMVLMVLVLDRWPSQAYWVALPGLLAYAASTAAIYRWPATSEESQNGSGGGSQTTLPNNQNNAGISWREFRSQRWSQG